MNQTNKILALDIEGTLISNAVSQIPRPGLYEFIVSCGQLFDKIVFFTAVPKHQLEPIIARLILENELPTWVKYIPVYNPIGETKDLTIIENSDLSRTILVDDMEVYVHPGQESNWMPIKSFEYPYSNEDNALADLAIELKTKIVVNGE